jgi:hypothetical protein
VVVWTILTMRLFEMSLNLKERMAQIKNETAIEVIQALVVLSLVQVTEETGVHKLIEGRSL